MMAMSSGTGKDSISMSKENALFITILGLSLLLLKITLLTSLGLTYIICCCDCAKNQGI